MIAAAIEHAGSQIAPIVTLSLGVGTISPTTDDDPAKFIESVDRRLYRAKQDGRNMIISR